jgi:hypothetical protein
MASSFARRASTDAIVAPGQENNIPFATTTIVKANVCPIVGQFRMRLVGARSGHGGQGAKFNKRRAHSLFAPRLACFRWRDDGAGVEVMIVGQRSLPEAITAHSSIEQERPCPIGAGNEWRARLFGLGILRVGRGRGQCQHKCDC